MPPEKDDLHASLKRVEAELEHIRKIDPAAGAHLEAALRDAKAAINAPSLAPSTHRSLVERLSDLMVDHEAAYPNLAANLGALVNALAELGI